VRFVGIRQGRARNAAAESHVVKLAAQRPQAGFNVTETLTISELSESHREILIPTRQLSVVAIPLIAGDALLELDVGEMSDQLGEDGSAGIHPPLFRSRTVQAIPTVFSSNRSWGEYHLNA
jgi:hypothetical protein